MPEAVLDLIEDKVDELSERKLRAEMRLFKLSLATSRGERVAPGNGFVDWLALSLFRQWVAENTTPPPPVPKTPREREREGDRHPPRAQPPLMSSGTFYRLLGTGGSSYLNHDECKKFVKVSAAGEHGAGGRETLKKFERRMDEVKAQAKEIVRPLMRNYLELDVGRDTASGGLGYLTCTKVEEADFPWDE